MMSSVVFVGLLSSASAAMPQGCSAFVPCVGSTDLTKAAANASYIPPACFEAVLQDPPPTNDIPACNNMASWDADSDPLTVMGDPCLIEVGTYIAGNCFDASISLPLAPAQLTATFPDMDFTTLSAVDKADIIEDIQTAVATGLAACCGFDVAKAWTINVVLTAGSVVATSTLPLSISASQAAAASTSIGTITANGQDASGPSAVTAPRVSSHANSGECGDAVTDVDLCLAACVTADPVVFSAKYLEAVPWLINFQQCECVGAETWTTCGGKDHLDFTLSIVIVLGLISLITLCCCYCCKCCCFSRAKKGKKVSVVEVMNS